MKRSGTVLALVAALVFSATFATAAVKPDGSLGYLSEPSDAAPMDIVRGYLQANLNELGLVAGDLDGVIVTDQYRSNHNGITHIYLRQTLDGVQVINANLSIHVDSQGRIINHGNNFVANLAGSANAVSPQISKQEAILAAAAHVGLPRAAELLHRVSEGGADLASIFEARSLSIEDIPIRLRYFGKPNGELRLVWETRFRLPNGNHWWSLWVDAENASVVEKADWIAQDSYNVFAYPKESPLDGGQTVETDPAHPIGSPFGWHDTDGAPGAEFNDTRGNNVEAQEDLDANNIPGSRPGGGPNNNYLFDFDADLGPGDNLLQAVTNLFYWNNVTHDLMYLYGFDEASGNFQVNNYGNPGNGGDPVQADAQDGSGTNNANFATPPDGADPRMQMFIWTAPATLTVNSPPNIAGDYIVGTADFGEPLDQTGLTGDLEVVDDGTGLPTEGCNALVGFTAGNVAVIDRGSCEFGQKVLNAEQAGASGAIVVNNQGDGILNMAPGALGGQVTIPSVFMGQSDGELIKDELGGGGDVNATMSTGQIMDRDSDNDNGIIVHEYGHGISNRLTGGPNNVSCLFNSEQMGEGWSDWLGLVMTAVETDTGPQPRGIGNYVVFAENDGPGIRTFPYSTDMAINPLTYADIVTQSVPHGVGEVWVTMIWDMYWALTDRYGWDEVFTNPDAGPGIALQLVMDGMKLQPCTPTFEGGRDAILDADMVNNGGANECLIWEAFADRGMGFSADAGGTGNTDGTEAFDLPPQCSGVGLDLSLSGSCPGPMTVTINGAAPGAEVVVGIGTGNGGITLPSGPCAGTDIELSGVITRKSFTADASGTVSFTENPGAGVCGGFVQAVDFTTCDASDLLSVP